MNFQTPNFLYPKFLVSFLPRKMCELSSFSSVLKMFFASVVFQLMTSSSSFNLTTAVSDSCLSQSLQKSTTQDKRVSSPKDKSNWHRIAKLLACSPLFPMQYLLRQISGKTTFRPPNVLELSHLLTESNDDMCKHWTFILFWFVFLRMLSSLK